jgi:signal peptidase II
MTPKLRVLLVVLMGTLPIDQLSKAWVAAHVALESPADRIPIIEGFFYVSHVRNPGAAFGLLQDWSGAWRLSVFIVVGLVAVVVILAFYRALAPRDRVDSAALGFILGGALGNLCDRVIHGEVIDFLHLRLWGERSWPDFNFADVFIVMGVTTLILELLASEGAARAEKRREPADGDDVDRHT